MSAFDEILIEPDFYVFRYQNNTPEIQEVKKEINVGLIQFHFAVKGKSKFVFNNGAYELDLLEEKSLLLYNPQKEMPLHLEIQPNSWVISILISIKKFHNLFSSEANFIPFWSDENKDKKYYKEETISPSMAIVLNQILHYNLNSSIKQLYFKGKSYEVLSLFFNKDEDASAENCPFLLDDEQVSKIKKAKEIIIQNLSEPPTLQALADQVNLSLKKLKIGFKQVYGNSVYAFLVDYKLEVARKMLDSGNHNVNEVSLHIGYSTASHFIVAFKKKFGTTPKKYIGVLR